MRGLIRLVTGVLVVMLAGHAALADSEAVPASRLGDSVFRDAWHAILKEADIHIKPVSAPRDVRRAMFARGEILLDCCSAPEWRDRQDEKAVQLFSVPFFPIVDHLILPKDRPVRVADPKALEDFTVGVVQGFTYPGQKRFGKVVTAVSMGEVFDLVVQGKVDLTIANSQEFARRQRLHHRPLVLGPEYSRLVLRVRVHKSRPDLLERVNKAIAVLTASGRINALTGYRLRDVAAPPHKSGQD